MKLLNIDANAKTVKGQERGFMTAVLYLAPANLSGFEVCPMATKGCRAGCLNTAGHGGMSKASATMTAPNGEQTPDNAVQRARIARTRLYFEARDAFFTQLITELNAFLVRAKRLDLTPVIRLNGTSDIPWERVPVFVSTRAKPYANIMQMFPDVQFYDYTKRGNRRDLPSNYHLTFSLAEDNDVRAAAALKAGMNVAVVFRTSGYGETYTIAGHTAPLVNGDESDLRFLDPAGSVVALYAKGRAKRDTTGFVRANAA